MGGGKSQIANRKSWRALLTVAFLVLGAAAWGIGWVAHSLVDRWAAPMLTATMVSTAALPPVTDNPTGLPASPPTTIPTQRPTSTFVPSVPVTSTAAPTAGEKIESEHVLASDRGLYDVIRRACGLPRDYILTPDDVIAQETWQLNSFGVENPTIFEGQAIQVPVHLCP